jgi:hypothetical protein
MTTRCSHPDGFLDHSWWTKKRTCHFLAKENRRFAWTALIQSKDDGPNFLPGLISPPTGTPSAGFGAKDAGMCKIRDPQRQALFNRQPI